MAVAPAGLGRRRGSLKIALSLATLAASVAVAGPGDLDPTFGTGGRVFFNIINVVESATSIAQQPDGKLLIGRWVYYWPSTEDLSVVRLNPDGSPDQGFGGDGRAGVDLGSQEGATQAVLALRDGRVIAAGRMAGYEDQSSSRFGVVRYAANGVVDSSFGASGVASGSFGATHASIDAIVEQPDGRLLGAGYIRASGQPQTLDTLIVRFNADGSIDTPFGDAGRLVIDFLAAARDDAAQALALQPDGKLVVAGYAFDSSGARRIAILRLTSAGQPDATFGMNGRAEIPQACKTPTAKVAVQLQSDGKILLAAQDTEPGLPCTGFVARLNPDGSPDLTFGAAGFASMSLGPCGLAGGSALAVEPGGAIILANTAGTPFSHGPADIRVARLTPLGEFDGTFGVNGTAVVDMGIDWRSSWVDPEVGVSMILQADGRIALAASDQFDWDFGSDAFLVARLRASGDSAGLIGMVTDYVSVDERAGSASLRVRRTGGASGATSADYAVVRQSPQGRPNFSITSGGTFTWQDGDASDRLIPLTILDDALNEGDEYVEIELAMPVGGAQLAAKSMFVRIADNEAPPPPPPPPPAGPGTSGGSSGGGGAAGWPLLLALCALLFLRHVHRDHRAHHFHAIRIVYADRHGDVLGHRPL